MKELKDFTSFRYYLSGFHFWKPELTLSPNVRIRRSSRLIGEPFALHEYLDFHVSTGGIADPNLHREVKSILQGDICVEIHEYEGFQNVHDGAAVLTALLLAAPKSSFSAGLRQQIIGAGNKYPELNTTRWAGSELQGPWFDEVMEDKFVLLFNLLQAKMVDPAFVDLIFQLLRVCEHKTHYEVETTALNLSSVAFPSIYEQRALLYKLVEFLMDVGDEKHNKWPNAISRWNDRYPLQVSSDFVDHIRHIRDMGLHFRISDRMKIKIDKSSEALGVEKYDRWFENVSAPEKVREMFAQRLLSER